MEETTLKEPVWVDRPSRLDQTIELLLKQPIVAVDTEANSLHAFREQVCLLQFSIPGADYLVDPLALTDLTNLAPLFADPSIEKVFHAAEYDIIGLKRDHEFEFNNLFDTMIAARILGRPGVGLGSMLESEFGIIIDKRYQRANWGQRPLTPAMLAYARLDTHYLIALRDHLKAELIQVGRWELAEEDFRRVTRTMPGEPEEGEAWDCWRVAGNQPLSPQQNSVLIELCTYRSRQAEAADLPLFKVLGNQTLLQIASELPNTLEQLQKIEGLSPRLIERHGPALLAAVRRGLRNDPVERPQHARRDDIYLNRLDSLRTWRKLKARELGVESDVVLPRDVLETIARAAPRSPAQLADLMEDLPWRFEHFGRAILDNLWG